MLPRLVPSHGSVRSHRPGFHAPALSRGLAVLLLGVALAALPAPGVAAETARGLREKQMIRTERLGILRPVGLAHLGGPDLFIVLPAPVAGAEPAAAVEMMDRFYHPVASIALSVPLANPRAVAYDRHGERLLMLDVASRSLHAIPVGADGEFASDRVVRLEAPRVGPLRSVGMTVDPATGEVFVLDRLLRRILRFTPAAPDAGAEALAAVPEARTIALGPLAPIDLNGLAFDPVSGHLFTLDPVRRVVHELGVDGSHVASYDVSAIRLSDPQGMVFAPSGDQTDDPATLSLFVADPGTPASRRGHVVELAWTTPVTAASEETSIQATTATLVRVTKTSLFSPPSPDPSGLAYDSVTGRLVIDDGEVDEMGIYAGKQVWETSLTGQVLRSYNVLAYTDEPVGIACNANNRHVFISDDDHDKVWDFNPGPDNLVGTSDDSRTSFTTTSFGSGDPEGLGYDRVGNRLFVTDGLNNEIYVLRAGANGTFEGGGDDQITHFDTGRFGIQDTDMVEWKPDTGTLLTLGSNGVMSVKEVTTTGTLVSEIDVSSFPLNQPAGLAYAPSSGGGGMSIYIVNRAVDNNSNSNENDGTMVELAIGGTTPSNTPPTVSAGPDRTITQPVQASLDGTVTDDGLPTPPTLTSTWTKVSGPGTVTFVNANAVDTQASFSASGTYVLQLTGSDGQMSASDQMQVIAQASTGGNVAPTVNAGPDQTITLPAQAVLNGTVTDDGLPSPPSLTTTWSKVSGPGTVTFVSANAVDTQASFSVAGSYVLQLAASDGSLSNSDQVQITAQTGGGGGGTSEYRIAVGTDDVEEDATGSVYNNSSDLELVFDTSNQTVGFRFTNVTVPKNATIATAYIQFQADEAQSEVTSLQVRGQAADNAAPFGTASGSVSSLPRTTASVSWTPAAWNTVGEAGSNQRTPEIKSLIQEIVNRSGWASGNALAVLVTGTGHRTAEAYEGLPAGAALLHIEVVTTPGNAAPTVGAGTDQTVILPAAAALDGTVTDDGLPSPPSLTTTWTKVSGPGTVSFQNANAVDTQASFSVAGIYVLQLGASDGSLSGSDQVQITVQAASGSNVAPTVSAGPDQTIGLPAQAALNGTVTDDGLPAPPSLTTTWSKVSGPGTVTFANANAVDTQASFSVAGTYVLQLAANDGALGNSDQVQVTVQSANTAPTSNAGLDLEVILPGQAALNGTVTDDGFPSPPALTTTWSMVSGPGTVSFQNPNAVDTQASFSVAGTYVLRLTASDGALTTTDQAQITVYPAGTVLSRIAVGSDDAEESATGNVATNGNDIELVYSGSNQTVGLRFTSLAIPQGATINSAAIQFRADESQSEATSLLIQGQAAGTTATFTNTSLNVSSRPRTAGSVTWTPPAWTSGQVGATQRTPDIKAIIQEIVNRADWVSGNSIVIIITGTGHRTAESHEGLATGAARLELQYQ